MDLKGASPASVVSARVTVFYEEEGVRTSYNGTVTAYDPMEGMRVWFDGLRTAEQEWVTAEDEWVWLDEGPLPEAGADALELHAVRITMKNSHENLDGFSARLRGGGPPKPALFMGGGALDGGAAGPSPRSFGRKARLLAGEKASSASPVSSRPTRESASGVRLAAQAAAMPVNIDRINERAEQAAANAAKARSGGRKPAAVAEASNPYARPDRKAPPSRSGARRKGRDDGAAAAAAEAVAAAAGGVLLPAPSSSTLTYAEQLAQQQEQHAQQQLEQQQAAALAAEASAASTAAQGAPPPATGKRGATAFTLKVRSRGEGNLLLLPEHVADRALAAMTQAAAPYPTTLVDKYGICPLSGLPAKYKCPRTGVRYGDLAAYKKLRTGGGSASGVGSEGEPVSVVPAPEIAAQ